jgi:hypothetical protein
MTLWLWLRSPFRMWASRLAYRQVQNALNRQFLKGEPLRVSIFDYYACKPYICSSIDLWMQYDNKLLTPFGYATVDRGPTVHDE